MIHLSSKTQRYRVSHPYVPQQIKQLFVLGAQNLDLSG